MDRKAVSLMGAIVVIAVVAQTSAVNEGHTRGSAGGQPDNTPWDNTPSFDVVVYGANAGGALASVAAARAGATTALLCQAWPDCFAPSHRIGGLTTGGLGTTDSCRQSADEPFDLCQLAITGGLAEEFYSRSAAHYGCTNCTASVGCQGCNWTLANRQMPYNVEPSVALSVLETMVAETRLLTVFYEAEVTEVVKDGAARITSLITNDGRTFNGTVYIDASYEGDLLARAGVDFTVGREAPSQYNETLNGRLRGDGRNDNNFKFAVDPFDAAGDTLPGIMSESDAAASAGVPGEGDTHVQAYNFRLCVTKNATNRLPFPKPDEYHAADFELLSRMCTARPGYCTAPSCNTAPIPNFKYDNNNCGPVSTDLITADYTNASWRNLTSWRYPEADYATRREIWNVHRRYAQGVLWTLAHDTRIPATVRAEMAPWGLCRDEFTETGGWPPTLYVREARRMVGERVLSESDVRVGANVDIGVASLGLAAHAEDSHNNQRFACRSSDTPPCYGDGPGNHNTTTPFAWNEGDFHSVLGGHIYQLPTYLALPKRSQASNLLVLVAGSSSHIAFSTFRMEPAFMVLGHSLGVWAALAVHAASAGLVRDVPLADLHAALVAGGQVLKTPAHVPPVGPPSPTTGYSCSRGFNRCLAVSKCSGTACDNNATCHGQCPTMGAAQWLALSGPNGGFALLNQTGGGVDSGVGGLAVKAISSKSYLKKNEENSGTLLPSEKKLIPDGTTLAIEEHAVSLIDGYWLVTLVAGVE
eukprot:m.325934 g.325934  ORF g.325934 m.325934 type:complete len:757 (+) comp27658_c2_seq4:168-2438(+)